MKNKIVLTLLSLFSKILVVIHCILVRGGGVVGVFFLSILTGVLVLCIISWVVDC